MKVCNLKDMGWILSWLYNLLPHWSLELPNSCTNILSFQVLYCQHTMRSQFPLDSPLLKTGSFITKSGFKPWTFASIGFSLPNGALYQSSYSLNLIIPFSKRNKTKNQIKSTLAPKMPTSCQKQLLNNLQMN